MKNKKLEKVIIVCAIAFVLLSLFFMFGKNLPSIKNKNVREMPEADSVTDELVKDIVISQTFDNDIDTIENIALVFTRFYRNAHGNVTLELSSGNTKYFQETVNISKISEQHRVFFTPKQPLTGMAGKKLTITVYADSNDYDGVGIMMKTKDVTDSVIHISKKTVKGTLCFSINEKKD